MLRRYLSGHWPATVLIVVILIVTTATSLLKPWPLQFIIDHVLGSKPLPSWLNGVRGNVELSPVRLLAGSVSLLLILFAVEAIADTTSALAWTRVGRNVVYTLAADVYRNLLRRSLLFHSRSSVGESLSRILSDSWCLYTAADSLVVAPLHALLVAIGIVVVMVQLNPGLTAWSLAVVPLMSVSVWWLGGRMRAAMQARRESESRIEVHLQQTLSGIPVVQGFAQEEREQQQLREYTARAIHAHRDSVWVENLSSLGSGVAMALGTAAILWIGAEEVLAGQLTIGCLIVFLAYAGMLHEQIKHLVEFYAALQAVRASVDRLLDLQEDTDDGINCFEKQHALSVTGHVRVEGVSFGYEAGISVLEEICLEVPPGRTLALVGPSGAGKTTLVSLIPRFFDPWQGRITIDGQDIRGWSLRSLRHQIALVLQESFLFPMTVAENIAYGRPDASPAEIEAAARAAHAHEFRTVEGLWNCCGELLERFTPDECHNYFRHCGYTATQIVEAL